MKTGEAVSRRTRDNYYDSSHHDFPELAELADLWRYRSLVVELMIRDIKVRYKRSVLGVAWTMLTPLLNMVALTLVFSFLFRQQISNYKVYYLTGSIYWSFFSTGTSYAASLTVDAGEMSKRIFVPRSVFVVSALGVGLVNLFLSFVPLLFIVLVTGFKLKASWMFLPVSVVLVSSFTIGLGFIVFTLASRFMDIREMYSVFVNTWFFITPIVYAPAIVPPKYRMALWFNPHYYLLQTFRDPLYNGYLPSTRVLAGSVVMALAFLIGGWSYYCRNIQKFSFRN
jgi:ABC-type polysaccharide/polyol phosphate export permease